MHKAALPTYVRMYFLSQFLKVVSAASHECLVISLGCAKFHLLHAEEKLRPYWVEAHVDILSSLLLTVTLKPVALKISFLLRMKISLSPKRHLVSLVNPRSYAITKTAFFSFVKPMLVKCHSSDNWGLTQIKNTNYQH